MSASTTSTTNNASTAKVDPDTIAKLDANGKVIIPNPTISDVWKKMTRRQQNTIFITMAGLIMTIAQLVFFGGKTKSDRNNSLILGYVATMLLIHTSFTTRNQANIVANQQKADGYDPNSLAAAESKRIIRTLKSGAVASDLLCFLSLTAALISGLRACK